MWLLIEILLLCSAFEIEKKEKKWQNLYKSFHDDRHVLYAAWVDVKVNPGNYKFFATIGFSMNNTSQRWATCLTECDIENEFMDSSVSIIFRERFLFDFCDVCFWTFANSSIFFISHLLNSRLRQTFNYQNALIMKSFSRKTQIRAEQSNTFHLDLMPSTNSNTVYIQKFEKNGWMIN